MKKLKEEITEKYNRIREWFTTEPYIYIDLGSTRAIVCLVFITIIVVNCLIIVPILSVSATKRAQGTIAELEAENRQLRKDVDKLGAAITVIGKEVASQAISCDERIYTVLPLDNWGIMGDPTYTGNAPCGGGYNQPEFIFVSYQDLVTQIENMQVGREETWEIRHGECRYLCSLKTLQEFKKAADHYGTKAIPLLMNCYEFGAVQTL